jgi:hypothetical protein
LFNTNVIDLPDYWTALVDPMSVTVTLTPIGAPANLYVADISNNQVTVAGADPIDCYFTVWAERCDVEKLGVEIDK